MKDNIVIDGKCYHLIQGDNDYSYFFTKFYDKPIDTLCVSETEVLYIPSEEWIRVNKKSYEALLKVFKAEGYDLSKYDESLYTAINKNIKFDANDELLKELKASVEFKNYLF